MIVSLECIFNDPLPLPPRVLWRRNLLPRYITGDIFSSFGRKLYISRLMISVILLLWEEVVFSDNLKNNSFL